VLAHLGTVNGWTRAQAQADLHRAAARCAELARHAWDLDLTVLAGHLVLPSHPDLYVPAADRPALGSTYPGPAK
jgi:hypothetical protein